VLPFRSRERPPLLVRNFSLAGWRFRSREQPGIHTEVCHCGNREVAATEKVRVEGTRK
jgi:hypothetical protein